MDGTDHRIIEVLKENSRATVSEISKRVNLSVPAVAERMRKLEQANVIEQYTVKVNRRKMGYGLLAYIFVSLDSTASIDHFRKEVVQYACVLEAHHTAGPHDYLLKVLVQDTTELEQFLSDTLKEISGVANSNTIICLSTLKEELNI